MTWGARGDMEIRGRNSREGTQQAGGAREWGQRELNRAKGDRDAGREKEIHEDEVTSERLGRKSN